MDIKLALIAAICPLVLAVLVLLVLLLRRTREQEKENLQQRLEFLERSLSEALRDMRGEQNSLARAARLENQNANDRLSEQIDKRVARLADMVGKRLEDLHRNLGEMQGLAGGVDDLKRILTNVKTRGIWGEMQLTNLLCDMLPKSRLAENVEVIPHSGYRVEFALRLPGTEQEILLPIDAKFPQEDYQRLQLAREEGRTADAELALKQLERRLKNEGKEISEKYICPPHSTDFGIMYLPSEGLYIEALNISGLVDELQRKHRVCIAGPSTLAALINSLQMGFKTLAVQERTNEVWRLLANLQQELEVLVSALDKSSKKLEEAQNSVATAQKKAQAISRKLQVIEREK